MIRTFTQHGLRGLLMMMLGFCIATSSHAQCANNNTLFNVDMTPAGVGAAFSTYITNVYGGEYVLCTVCEGATYTFSTCDASYDTQITLYQGTSATSLAYNDDGCAPGSFLTWTATFDGQIRILIDEYNCLSNVTNTPLEVTQTTACPTAGGCPNNNTYYGDMTPAGVGSFYTETLNNVWGGDYYTLDVCEGAEYTISMCGSSWDSQITLYDELTGDFLFYSDDDCGNDGYLNFTVNYTGTIEIVIDQWNCVSNTINATLSVTQETACGGCNITNVLVDDFGCNGTQQDLDFYVNYTGACEVYSLWTSVDGAAWTELVLPAGITSGEAIGIFFNVSNAVYDFYFELTDGTTSLIYFLVTDDCDGGCDVTDVLAIDQGCVGLSQYVDFYVYYTGGCYVYSLWSSVDGGPWTEFVLDGTATSGDLIAMQLNVSNAEYAYYFELSDGNTSNIEYFFTDDCDGGCEVAAVDADDLGCEGESQAIDFTVYYTGACYVYSMWVSVDGGAWEELVLDGTAGSGDAIAILFNVSEALYEYYFELSDGTTSDIYVFLTDDCAGGCEIADVEADDLGCDGESQAIDFTVYYTGACYVYSMWVSVDGGAWEELVLDGTAGSGDAIGILFNVSEALYEYYFELSDGTTSDIYLFITDDCDGADCTNLQIDYTDTGCYDTGVSNVPSGDITPTYTGACTVAGVYVSVDGGAFEYLDLSAYGFGSGDDIALLFNIQDALYEVYYVLDDGSESPSEFFVTEMCDSGVTICDCAGNQPAIEATAWLGDGTLDDGTYEWNGVPVDFDCATWGFDCGDELEPGLIAYDPYGVCSGALPPANGCVDEFCYNIDIDVYTDCWPGEVSVYVFNENQDLVMAVPAGSYVDEEALVTISLCLPAGCYNFMITDEFGDGLAGADCNEVGYFGVWDWSLNEYVVFISGSDYTFDASDGYCVGPQTECENLEMEVYANDCFATADELLPAIYMDFSYDGNCTVTEIYISADGGDFEVLDVSAEGWEDGDTGTLYFLQPNTEYTFYYVTDDGAVSFLYSYTTDDCSNEIAICDCDGTELTIGATAWLGDGFADDGFYEWAGQPVNFNCATWGYDCGDIEGAPSSDPFNVCDGELPPFNGCIEDELVMGCTDPDAINYDPQAEINDGSCIYDISVGCTDDEACNYSETATIDDGSCEYVTCAGCTDPDANNYDPNATIDDGSCDFAEIEGCTDPDALNYNPLATVDDGSCIDNCIWPSIAFDDHCVEGDLDNFYIDVDVNTLGNGAPYTITNTYNNQQIVTNLLGEVTMGPFPSGTQVVVTVSSNIIDCLITSQPLTEDCSAGGVYGCNDPTAINYNPNATIDDGSCIYIGVEEIESKDFTMYPNPASEYINITSTLAAGKMMVNIMDASGRVVLSSQQHFTQGSSMRVDISALAQGNYVIELSGEEHLQHIPLIIQR
ncbi:MAG: T9SS type A sorting domain-containing protein [Flavobacteriales bacterium]